MHPVSSIVGQLFVPPSTQSYRTCACTSTYCTYGHDALLLSAAIQRPAAPSLSLKGRRSSILALSPCPHCMMRHSKARQTPVATPERGRARSPISQLDCIVAIGQDPSQDRHQRFERRGRTGLSLTSSNASRDDRRRQLGQAYLD
ncbi:hypothetical protein V8C34DRAFT_280114 [Trichoderma compactum]